MIQEPSVQAEPFAATLRHGMIWVEWTDDMTVSDGVGAELVARANALAPDEFPPMVVILNGMVSLTRCALHGFATDLNVSAMAIVGPSAVDRTLAHFFTEVHKPYYPTSYFESEPEAVHWLESQVRVTH